MSVIQALAMTVAEIPVFLYTTFGQVKVGGSGPCPLTTRVPETEHQEAGPSLLSRRPVSPV